MNQSEPAQDCRASRDRFIKAGSAGYAWWFARQWREQTVSMIGNLRLSTDAEIAALLSEPESIMALLYPDDEPPAARALECDLDKAWHAIHFMLAGDPWEGEPPLNFIVAGGTPVGEVDVGYGPARVFDRQQVREIAAALEPITVDELRSRFDPKALTKESVYPQIWQEPDPNLLDKYLLRHFVRLRDFVWRARDEGRALIVYLN